MQAERHRAPPCGFLTSDSVTLLVFYIELIEELIKMSEMNKGHPFVHKFLRVSPYLK